MAEKIQEPVIGRHVLYVLGTESKNKGQVRSAVVALVHDVPEAKREENPGLANLTVFIGTEFDIPNQNKVPGNATWLFKSVKFDAGKKPGTWHWPEHAIVASKKAEPVKSADAAK